MEEKIFKIVMSGHKRILSREGGVAVEELCFRTVEKGHDVTVYNRGGHHVSGYEFDTKKADEYKGIHIKTVPNYR